MNTKPFAVIARRHDVTTACMVIARFDTMEEAHAKAQRIRPTMDGVLIAPVTAAYVAARRVVAAL